MEQHETLILILAGSATILGLVGTVAYYFARYGVRSSEQDQEVFLPPPEKAKDAVELKQSPTLELVPPAQKKAEAKPELVTLDRALANTKASLWGRLKGLIGAGEIPKDLRDQIEEILYTSDLGVATVERLMAVIDEKLSGAEKANADQIRLALKEEMVGILKKTRVDAALANAKDVLTSLGAEQTQAKPVVWLVVGVNGVGKTTTIGKLAFALAQGGKKVLVAAGDTFRAAAGAQLRVWSERAQVEIFSPEGVTDPAAVAYQALERARGGDFDVVIVDTAGRLHTQKNLMDELKKVKRVLAKLDETAPHQSLLVLDANSGQNALVQAREFHQALDLTGVILTKMDGTAKGGVALSLAVELNLPLRLIGVGESVQDLRPFQPQEYVDAIL